VIAMQVGDKDMIQAVKADMIFAHLQLGAFTTVNQIQFVTQIYDLCSGSMTQRRRSRTAAQYVDFKT
jgi:hypothetical protein